MTPIRAIADLPFVRRDVLDLLNLRHHRAAPDPDYTGFGHARLDALQLAGDAGEPIEVRGALVIAVHSMEEPEELPGDIDLEFFLPEVSEDHSVTVLLSAFLRVWLPLIRGDERAIVLVVCNPNQTLLPCARGRGADAVLLSTRRRRVLVARRGRPRGRSPRRPLVALRGGRTWLSEPRGPRRSSSTPASTC